MCELNGNNPDVPFTSMISGIHSRYNSSTEPFYSGGR